MESCLLNQFNFFTVGWIITYWTAPQLSVLPTPSGNKIVDFRDLKVKPPIYCLCGLYFSTLLL